MLIKTSSTMINYTCLFKCTFHANFVWTGYYKVSWFLCRTKAGGLLEGSRESLSSPNHVCECIWKKGGMYVTIYFSFSFKWSCTSFWLPLSVHRHHTGWFLSSGHHLSKTLKRTGTKWTIKFSLQFCHPQFNSTNTVFTRFLLCGKQQMWIYLRISSSNIYLISFMSL